MSPDVSTVPVVVVGAGPTGTSAAIELGLRGIECLVLDRWEDVYPKPRAVHLDDEVYRIVDRLGVGEQFAAISRPGGGLRLVDRTMRMLGEFARVGVSETNGHHRANMFDQPDLERLLRARMHEQASVSFRGGVVVDGVDQVSPDLVRVRFHDAETLTAHAVETQFVLGCDGANSAVRAAIGSSMIDLGFEQRWLVVDVATTADLRQWEGVHQVCDTTRAATYMRIGETRYRWEFQLHDDETAADFTDAHLLEPLLRPWLGDIGVRELQVLRTAEYTFRAAIADRWRSGRIFLLGDAAHLTPPFIGQGMGAGLRDAANLAWKIAGFLTGRLRADVLDSYEPERAAHARAMIVMARRVGVVMTRGGRLGDVLRRTVVPLLGGIPVVGQQVTDSTTPALTRSPLIDAARTDRLAGQLCPNPLLDGRRLDDVLDAGWALVTTQAVAPSARSALDTLDCVVVETTPGDELATWLGRGRALAALVRPDRTVLAAGTDVTRLCALLAALVSPALLSPAHAEATS
ncbi:bifunctional 3-(3-hydroxy-phenyl)propionate/3-hydroxycinnamic acid hydroxylase MhpA [Aeromicrobium fastidiosum]|uniref:Bifunctional 3-(3-hydroxy-phenyl)propionate/3-hydroxycinnamic acid hydroxylase n=1 Tax=Aeromicrobium fastidiosum TaxID=52699 RepID=A0A641AMV8_9ACTN|nr:bifunctional 3-(3-hydroxy-phenyl)propionate/3-hydroxycinnamic acid hydroxylase [Aeromicrobium fastidiosum]KAA1378604.1 bifunctional 3-(3-hydroxy-phenyl)propionate/3-hydroxycinnamic acid hydroxylase [Aeromicrobium fastidiosum]MBP2392418.1 3-(3-hydroxy-phenyl)propionate hydroxylase [Aeromicrobium fastidiosum]